MSIYYKENKNFITQNNIRFIEETVLKEGFPFYINSSTKTQKDDSFLSHKVLSRLEETPNYDPINSDFFEPTISILNNFVNSIKENINFSTRIG